MRRKRLLKKLTQATAKIIKTTNKPLRLMFQDEARFGRISNTKRCWAHKGIRPVVPNQIVREYTYAYAAVSPHDGTSDTLVLPWVNTEMMGLFLHFVSQRHPDEHIVMVLDGASWHTSSLLHIPENISIIPLPPHSPELNPVECFWKEVRKEGFYNCVFNSMDAVEDQLCDTLLKFENNPSRIQSLTGFHWITRIPLKQLE